MIDVKKSANRFWKEFAVKTTIDKELLERVIEQQGFTIIYFRAQNNGPEVEIVLEKLNLESMAMCSRGFVYADEKFRLVFINDDLTEEEKRIVLLHEEGHIYLEHARNHKVIGLDVVEEHEANEFVHYILYPSSLRKFTMVARNNKKLLIVTTFVLIVVAIVGMCYRNYMMEQSYYGDYYVTKTGTKYHRKDCGTIEGKEIRRLTIEDMDDGKYAPCSICIGDEVH